MIPQKDRERIIFGCGYFGGIGSSPDLLGKGEGREQAHQLLNLAREFGLARFDTANTYGGGRSEEYLGSWLSEQGSAYRQSIQIATKVGNPTGTRAGHTPLSRIEITTQIEESLRRLRTDYVDVYYVHEIDPSTPLVETIEAFAEVLAGGKAQFLGLSNVDLPYVKEFLELADETTRRRLLYVQNEFNFLQQRDRRELIPFLQTRSLRYAVFSPLAGGLLTGKYQWNSGFPPGSRLTLRPEPYRAFLNQEAFDRIQDLKTLSEKNGRSLPEEALRFVLDTQGVDSVIIGPRCREHFESLGFRISNSLKSGVP
ncbi:MAG: aldo/keto reductase [Acidobacteria bacterium]|nr:aldo/keto reductase [Acidobacteriota bacterium]